MRTRGGASTDGRNEGFMARDVSDSTPISGRGDLVAWLESGCKPAARHRIGTEHEKIGFYRAH